jgi:hypothetical protein
LAPHASRVVVFGPVKEGDGAGCFCHAHDLRELAVWRAQFLEPKLGAFVKRRCSCTDLDDGLEGVFVPERGHDDGNDERGHQA